MANEIILQKHMNAEEQAQALKLFKQLLTEKPEILKDTRYTPAQTIEQSCFISGGFENEAGEFKSCLDINYRGLNISIYLKNNINEVTPDDIEKALNNEIEENKRRIKEALQKIEIIHAETLEAVKIYNNIFDKSKKFKTRILRRILENRLYKF